MTAETILAKRPFVQVPDRLERDVWQKIEAIRLALLDHHEEKFGLLDGRAGIALFFSRYYKLTGNIDSLATLRKLMDECVDHLSGDDFQYSFCSGFTGIAWAIHHLADQHLIEHPDDATWRHFDRAVAEFTIDELNRGIYDFVQGGLGGVPYLLARHPNGDVEKVLVRVVDALASLADRDEHGIRWKDFRTRIKALDYRDEPVYNLGLAHGIPSVISILSMIYRKGIARKKVKELIDGSVDWLLNQKNKLAGSISVFPAYISVHGKKISNASRLGWCCGDLGAAVALNHAGFALNHPLYKNLSEKILLHTRMSRTCENGLIEDASIGHGSMGVSHIYRRMYRTLGQPWLRHEADRWLETALDMTADTGAPAGFDSHAQNSSAGQYDLMEGLAGIGLALMSAVNAKDASWDRSFLIS